MNSEAEDGQPFMSKVISGMSMSLDGFITAPEDTRE
jgi:hypothetical protein